MGLFSTPRRTPLAAAVALLALTAAATYWVRERPVRLAAREAHRALAAGRFDEARAAAGRWLRARPGAAEAHYLKAKAALALGRRPDVYDGLKQAQALGYPDDRLAVLRALVDAQAGRLGRAVPVLLRAFDEAREPDPMLDEALARVLMETYDWPQAEAVLTRWATDAPADPRPPLWRAQVHRRRDSAPEVVLADFREALRRDPGLAEARLGLAEELLRARRYREAAVEFDAYLAVRPDDPAGHLGAGRDALALGDLDAATRRIDRALALDPENGEAHKERARLARHRGDEAVALLHLDRAIERTPYDSALHYSRLLALNRLGRRDEADREQRELDRLKADLDGMNAIQERLVKTPHDAALQSRLARWMFSHGYDREGLNWARKILSEHPGHPDTCSLLSGYYQRQGNPELASYYQSQIAPAAAR